MTRLLSAVLLTGMLFGASRAADPEDRTKLLAEVTDRHRETLDAIRTVSFAFERTVLKYEPPQGHFVGVGDSSHETGPGRYRQTPERWRSTAVWSDGSTVDEVYRHHTLLSLRTWPSGDGHPTSQLTREFVTPWSRNGRDRLAELLFGHIARDAFAAVPFHHLIEQPHKLHAVERLPDGEVRVELSHGEGRYEFWFSPTHHHLIRKRVWHPADAPAYRHEVEVTRFAEPDRWRFFPTAVAHRSFEGEELKHHGELKLSEVEVNRPIPNEAFRLPNIAWMTCKDLTRQRSYQVDADGYRLGEVLGTDLEGARAAAPRPPSTVAPTTAEAENPIPWWVWAVIASLCVCLVAAVMEIRRLRTPVPPAPPR